jgi:subtilisin family serine protease
VLLEQHTGPEHVDGILDRAELRPEVSIPEAGAVAVEPPGGRAVAGVRSALRGQPGVAAVEPEYRRSPRLIPDDPAFSLPDARAPLGDTYQWYLRKAGFERAWSRSKGATATLAVIDSGIDGANPDLEGRVVAAVDRDQISGHGPATVDENGHGTHIAGLGCATADNGYGGASSSFGCRLIVVKSDLTDASIADSIIDATDRGADVINLSFGGPGASQVIKNAVAYAWSHDVVMVAAASNADESDQGVPARLLQPKGTGPRLRRGKGLVVTAAEFDGSRAWFKPGRGSAISLAAYGAASLSKPGIFSNFPSNLTELEIGAPFVLPPCQCRTSFEGDRRFAYLEGTSVASPQVAGAAALIRSLKPGIDAKRIIRILKRKARGRRFSGKLGWGILNAGAALRAAAG